MSTKKIFVVNMILLALCVVVFTVISLVPNNAKRLEQLQENYVPSAVSGEEDVIVLAQIFHSYAHAWLAHTEMIRNVDRTNPTVSIA